MDGLIGGQGGGGNAITKIKEKTDNVGSRPSVAENVESGNRKGKRKKKKKSD
jgi:hypothetical protein